MNFKKLLGIRFIGITLIFLCSGCSAFCGEEIPYAVKAEMTMKESAEYQIAGLDFGFFNKTKKDVKSFTLVFCFFDQNGEPISFGKNNQVINVVTQVNGGEYLEGCLSLDEYLYLIPEEPYEIDFLYVSQISYEDGSTWSDPFGLLAY